MHASLRHRRGFTLVELMVTIAILGGVLLLVPPNLYRFGARSRLDNAANTLLSYVGYCRERAILDGYPVRLELSLYKDGDGVARHGHRLVFISDPVQRTEQFLEDSEATEEERRRPKEREWLTTAWMPLGDGIVFSGVSQEANNWQRIRERPYSVSFGPDGSVEFGFAIRVESEDIETDTENRTITILVNALTAEAWSVEGYEEMPELRGENDFVK